MSLSVTRPIGRALVVASPSSRSPLVATANRLGFECTQCDDPYGAMLELARHRLAYSAMVLSLSGLYREELTFISAIKRRLPHVEIWLAHTDGRQGTLAEAMRVGADGLIDTEGLHRIATPSSIVAPGYQPLPVPLLKPDITEDAETPEPLETTGEIAIGEPVLTSEELRALLQDQPMMPPSGKVDES